MTKKKLIVTLATVLTLSLFAGLIGCGSKQSTETKPEQTSSAQTETAAEPETPAEVKSGVISIKVNPEIAVFYDEAGKVTAVEGRNDDGKKIAIDYKDFEGKECRVVVGELIAMINKAGYFAEETEGQAHQITLEVEKGSVLPSDNFLSNIVAEIQTYTSTEKINTPVAVNGESTYGWTNYGDTDYGPNNDGITNYDDTDYGTSSDGVTNYDDKPEAASTSAPASTSNTSSGSGSSNSGSTNRGSTSGGSTNSGTAGRDRAQRF